MRLGVFLIPPLLFFHFHFHFFFPFDTYIYIYIHTYASILQIDDCLSVGEGGEEEKILIDYITDLATCEPKDSPSFTNPRPIIYTVYTVYSF